ncbi:RNA 2',3'-cyclic phosphodiesterase [Kosmotoga pacifica]|uniref:RNA 2',3'-cyclic phosphodiesterase n=1 Tax=Kosmotoga pacifica TaxID=1330330 RepID=A0A0G2Z5T9_9BACT|nr:RNA 2',3'-cyclic phosphodiesterase [Kosmotoga pacifica]AKI96960.1 2'-5' RNA ligase [Kosmotoga pacifica]
MRTFIAIDTGQKVAEIVDIVVEKLKRMGFKASWVPGSNAHLTLAFLNEVKDEKVELIASMLSKRLRGFPTFTFSTGKLGFFRHKNLPRVIWIGVKSSPILNNLFRETRVALESLGFNVDENFHAHITVGRMKFSPPYWRKLIETVEIEEVIVPVSEVSLFKSELSPEGAKYTKLFSCSFEGGLIKYDS